MGLDNKVASLVFLVPCTMLQIMSGFKHMSGPEAKQGKPVMTYSRFLSATLSQCTYMVVEDLCRVIPAESQASLQCVPVLCSP